MVVGRIAPSSTVPGEIIVGRAEVGSSDKDRTVAGLAPCHFVGALDLETGPTRLTVVEQRRAQRRRLQTVGLLVQSFIPACSFYNPCREDSKIVTPY